MADNKYTTEFLNFVRKDFIVYNCYNKIRMRIWKILNAITDHDFLNLDQVKIAFTVAKEDNTLPLEIVKNLKAACAFAIIGYKPTNAEYKSGTNYSVLIAQTEMYKRALEYIEPVPITILAPPNWADMNDE